MAGRLKLLGIRTLVIDKRARLGDNWRNRDHELVLQNAIW